MENSKKYNFEHFTLDHYNEILFAAKSNYIFCNYENFYGRENFILWRHDVDFSMDYCLIIAEIDNSFNIQSTFFFHLHNEFYNLLELQSKKIIHKILDLGHKIGIHFDTHYYNIKSEKEINAYLLFEKKIFKKLFGIEPKVFSFHNTNDFTMSCTKRKYGGLINTYQKYLQKNVKYCSDSNGYWRFDILYDLIISKKYEKLQILTHPDWWQEKIRSPKERIHHIIKLKSESLTNFYNNTLKEYGRENIDW